MPFEKKKKNSIIYNYIKITFYQLSKKKEDDCYENTKPLGKYDDIYIYWGKVKKKCFKNSFIKTKILLWF